MRFFSRFGALFGDGSSGGDDGVCFFLPLAVVLLLVGFVPLLPLETDDRWTLSTLCAPFSPLASSNGQGEEQKPTKKKHTKKNRHTYTHILHRLKQRVCGSASVTATDRNVEKQINAKRNPQQEGGVETKRKEEEKNAHKHTQPYTHAVSSNRSVRLGPLSLSPLLCMSFSSPGAPSTLPSACASTYTHTHTNEIV